MKLRMEEKYIKRRAVVETIMSILTLAVYTGVFVYGIIK